MTPEESEKFDNLRREILAEWLRVAQLAIEVEKKKIYFEEESESQESGHASKEDRVKGFDKLAEGFISLEKEIKDKSFLYITESIKDYVVYSVETAKRSFLADAYQFWRKLFNSFKEWLGQPEHDNEKKIEKLNEEKSEFKFFEKESISFIRNKAAIELEGHLKTFENIMSSESKKNENILNNIKEKLSEESTKLEEESKKLDKEKEEIEALRKECVEEVENSSVMEGAEVEKTISEYIAAKHEIENNIDEWKKEVVDRVDEIFNDKKTLALAIADRKCFSNIIQNSSNDKEKKSLGSVDRENEIHLAYMESLIEKMELGKCEIKKEGEGDAASLKIYDKDSDITYVLDNRYQASNLREGLSLDSSVKLWDVIKDSSVVFHLGAEVNEKIQGVKKSDSRLNDFMAVSEKFAFILNKNLKEVNALLIQEGTKKINENRGKREEVSDENERQKDQKNGDRPKLKI